jgi:Ni2+-binding GTPase involved in maturation of urease and hydrogenase
MDMAAAAEFDRQSAEHNIQSVRPKMRTLCVSAKTGEGMAELLGVFGGLRKTAEVAG